MSSRGMTLLHIYHQIGGGGDGGGGDGEGGLGGGGLGWATILLLNALHLPNSLGTCTHAWVSNSHVQCLQSPTAGAAMLQPSHGASA